jgi:Na+/melibiose symporter-like transporter
MAYTLQTIILFVSLGVSKYDGSLHNANPESAKLAITVMLTVIPPVLFFISLIVFSTKFKLHGEFMDNITKIVTENRAKREAAAAE